MRIPSRAAVFTAFVSGQAAGLVMLATAMAVATLRGSSPLRPLQVMTALILGESPLHALSLSSVLPGFLAHQAGPTMLWSRVFGGIVGLSLRRQLNGRNLWAQNVPLWVIWATHLVFGISLGVFYWRWQPRPSQGQER